MSYGLWVRRAGGRENRAWGKHPFTKSMIGAIGCGEFLFADKVPKQKMETGERKQVNGGQRRETDVPGNQCLPMKSTVYPSTQNS
jgi:hypothetical protein